MTDCIFCAIIAGNIPSIKIHEDESTIAFLDIQPLARGHTLVIPKEHEGKLADLSSASAAALMATVQELAPKICQAAQCPDATIAINDGPAAGQEVPHVHVHIVPRTPGDAGGPIHALFTQRPQADADDLQAFAEAVTG